MQLRDYQIKAVHDIRTSLQTGHKSPLLVLPTGGGKTIVFCYIAKNACDKGRRVLVLVHRVELLRQTYDKMRAFGIRTGLISPLYTPDFNAPVQVAMVQTLSKRTHLYKGFDLVIVDEAHHATASTYAEIIRHYGAITIGVTATPCRADGRGLGVETGGIFNDLVLGPSMPWLIENGFLVRPRVFAPPTSLDFSGIKKTAGDFNRKQLGEFMDKGSITGDAVDHYRQLCAYEPGVAFCVSVEHAKHVAAQFRDQGFGAESVDGSLDDATRSRILRGLADGSISVVTSCDVISEGTDIPAIRCGIMLRATQSKGLYIQQGGRVLRPYNGKTDGLILDHVGNTFEHGFLDGPQEWSLDGEEKKSKKEKNEEAATKIYQCKACYMVFLSAMDVCPACGTPKERKGRQIKMRDGSLVELGRETRAQMALKKQGERREVGSARSLEELMKIATERGYKPGWAEHIFNSRQK
jgi:DNA repair protein RadD